MLDFLTVGTIINVHGVRGEVKVMPETDDAARFKKLKNVWLQRGSVRTAAEIKGVKLQNRFVILKLEGFDDRDSALKLKGQEIVIGRKDAVKLPPRTYFIGDLIGCAVREEDGTLLGKVKDVIPGAGCDVYDVYDEDGNNIMIPAIEDVVISVDVEGASIVVKLLPGLKDIYLGK